MAPSGRVSSDASTTPVADIVTGSIRGEGKVHLQGVGTGTVKTINQRPVDPPRDGAFHEFDSVRISAFVDVEIKGEERTALRFTVKPRE